jgi:hypothetical protein
MSNFFILALMNYLFRVLIFVLPLNAVGQVSNEDLKTMRIVSDLERESRPSRSGVMGPEVEGSQYYSPSWNAGSLTLYRENKTYELKGLKYDMLNYGIDILFDKGVVKSLDGNMVQTFEYKDSLTNLPHRFVNAKEFTREGAPIRGFMEVLCWGKVDVYSFTETTLLRPNYNTAIGSGNQNYVISKKRVLLYSPGTELRPLNKKDLTKIWAEREVEMKKFQKVNKLNLSKERDLMLMVDYFNTL